MHGKDISSHSKADPVIRKALPSAAFSVNARVAMQLGRESVGSSNTAIVELVKNAYDADARKVILRFSGLGTPQAALVIADDGHGMTENELRDHWLCIGTSNKQDTYLSKAGRVQTGEKGLGRLGLDRLCQRTTLQTRRKLSSEEQDQPDLFPDLTPSAVELDVRWDRYQVRGQRLEMIAHEVYSLDHLNFDPISGEEIFFPHGTRMILRELKDLWSKDRLIELADELSLMLSPFADRSDFSIEIDTGMGLEEVDGEITASTEFLRQATWKIEADITSSLDPTGVTEETVVIKMSSPQHPRVQQLGPLRWQEWMGHGSKENGPKQRVSRCGPMKVVFHVFIQGTGDSDQSSSFRSFLTANRGIRIYRDGFRVKPYGDPRGTSDWLSLSMRRAINPAAISRRGWKLAYHQVIGAVMISRLVNTNLEDQSNREGILQGPGFADLTSFATKVVVWFEGKATDDYVEQNPVKKRSKAEKEEADIFAQAEVAVKQLTLAVSDRGAEKDSAGFPVAADLALNAVRAVQTEVATLQREHDVQLSEMREETDMLRSLASLGIMAAYFGHERVGDAGSVRQKIAELRRLIKNPDDSLFSGEHEKLETVDLLEAGIMRIESFARFALDTVRPWKRHEPPADLVAVIHRTVTAFRDSLLRSGVRMEPDDIASSWRQLMPLAVNGRTVQWECIITNFLVNSLWALRQKVAADRTIRLEIEPSDNFVVLSFQDSGVGLEAGSETDVFRPGFSTKRDHYGKQEGTGLGLSLVKSFVEDAGGSIAATANGPLGGALFSIKVPKRQIEL